MSIRLGGSRALPGVKSAQWEGGSCRAEARFVVCILSHREFAEEGGNVKTKKNRQEKDPAVLYGQRFKTFRVQFWEYFLIHLLEAFAGIAEDGGFGKIDAFRGVGRDVAGKEYAFEWNKGGTLQLTPGTVDLGSGYLNLKGELDYCTINRIRNFPLFHTRGQPTFVPGATVGR